MYIFLTINGEIREWVGRPPHAYGGQGNAIKVLPSICLIYIGYTKVHLGQPTYFWRTIIIYHMKEEALGSHEFNTAASHLGNESQKSSIHPNTQITVL